MDVANPPVLANTRPGDASGEADSVGSCRMTDRSDGIVGATAALLARAVARHREGDLDSAARLYENLLRDVPDLADGWANLGMLRRQLGRLDDAERSCRRALAIDGGHANALNNLGIVLAARGRYPEAIAAYRAVTARHPRFHEAWCNLGLSLSAAGQPGEAGRAFATALKIAPDYTEALVQFVFHKLQCCDWDDLDGAIGGLSAAVASGAGTVNPFALLPVCRDPRELLRAARGFSARIARSVGGVGPPTPTRSAGVKIRIGYVSSDFHRHAVSTLAAELFEAHDGDRFEVTGYSHGPDIEDAMRGRLRGAFAWFVDIAGMGAAEAVDTIRRDGIDILVDLNGHTRGARTELFARRAAPIQVNYLGYPGTMGADFVDYVVADHVVAPPGAEADYSEKIVRLAGSYQPNDGARPLPSDPPPRSGLGLPETGFVFCCFNQAFKITPDMLDTWFRLLRDVPGSVLWLLAFNAEAPVRLRALAKAAGIDPSRLVFAPNLPADRHLARLQRADLVLDTHPYGAHTTASDALWAGVSVLTMAGATFQSRVAASLLTALGVGEPVTRSLPEYHALGRSLATDRGKLEDVRRRIVAARSTSDLFSGRAMARKLEAAYAFMWRRHCAGQAPDHFTVDRDGRVAVGSGSGIGSGGVGS